MTDFNPNLSSLLDKKSQRIDLKITMDNEHHSHYLPLSIINGKEKGKVITIVAGVHGYEYPPIIAIQQLLNEINPNELIGTLIFIPIANMGAFQKRVPFLHPTDNKNLNYIFPGNKNGSISEKIADYITQNIILISDIFIDIHGGDANEDLVPFTCYYDNHTNPQNTQIAQQLCEVCSMPYIVSYPYTISKTEPALYAIKQAVQNEIVGLSLEVGKLGTNDPKDVELITDAIYNILSYLNLYSKTNLKTPNPNAQKFSSQFYIKSPTSGIFYSSFKAGDFIKIGQEIGYITDEFGNILEKITAEESGFILYKIGTPPINKGETICCIVK